MATKLLGKHAKYKVTQNKIVIRAKVFDYFSPCTNILSLCNLDFSLENSFINENKRVTVVEINPHIYKKQLKIADERIELIHDNILKSNPKKFDGLFLDFCGPYSSKMKDFLLNINRGSKVVLTFLAAREHVTLKSIINIYDRERSYIDLLKSLGFMVEYYSSYNSPSPMLVFFCRKI